MAEKQTLPLCSAIIVAAGSSRRMGSIDKQMLLINGVPVLAKTLLQFEKSGAVGEIIVVAKRENLKAVEGVVRKFGISKAKAVVPGGETRSKSVVCGLEKIGRFPIVLIHDGARPFVSASLIRETVMAAAEFGAAAPGVVPKDTVKEINPQSCVIKTPRRDMLRLIQTPQAFKRQLIQSAYENADKLGFEGTDDCSVAEFAGANVKIIDGDYTNIKITTPADIPIAEAQAGRLEQSEKKSLAAAEAQSLKAFADWEPCRGTGRVLGNTRRKRALIRRGKITNVKDRVRI